MRQALVAAVTLLCLSGLQTAAQNAPRQTPHQAADAFLSAREKGDAAAMNAIARREDPDPFLVAEDLWLRHVEFVVQKKKVSVDFLGAALALAEAARTKKVTAALAARIARWSKLGPKERATARDLGRLHLRLNGHREKAEWKELLAAAGKRDALLAGGGGTLAAVKIRTEIAIAWKGLGKPATAAAEYDKAADLAGNCGWPRAEGDALQQAGSAWMTAGKPPNAVRAWSRELEIQTSIARPRRIADAKLHLGSAYCSMHQYDKALTVLETARTAMAELGDRQGEVKCLMNIGFVFLRRHELQQALAHMEKARVILEAAGESPWEVVAEMGSAYIALGNYPKARECFERAIAHASDERPEQAAGYLSNLAILHIRAGEFDRAIERCQKAIQLFRSTGNSPGLANAQVNMGEAYFFSGRFSPASEAYEQALAVTESIHEPRIRGAALGGLGKCCRHAGRYEEALRYYEQALTAHEACGDRLALARIHGSMGHVYADMTRFDRAISCYLRVMKMLDETPAPRARATTLGALGDVYYRIGQYEQGLRFANRALKGYQALGDKGGTAHTLGQLGRIHIKLGNYGPARRCLKRAISLYAGTSPHWSLRLRGQLAYCYLEQECFDEALAESRAVLEIAAAQHDSFGLAHCNGIAGSACLMLGKLGEAEGYLQRGLAGMRAIGDHQNSAGNLWALARVHLRKKEWAKAVACAEEALDCSRKTQSGLHGFERRGLRGDSREIADLGLAAAHACLGNDPPTHDRWNDAAFRFCEAGRGMMLVEQLINRQCAFEARLPADLRAEVEAARKRVAATLQRTLAATRQSGAQPVAARTTNELDDTYLAWRQVVAEIRRKAPRVGELLFFEPIALGRFRAAIPQDDVWLHYQLAGERGFVLTIGCEGTTLTSLGSGHSITRAIETYTELARNPQPGPAEEALAADLYAKLIKPIEPLLREKKRLLVSPDETMVFLPFEALIRRDEAGNSTRLIEKWSVTYAVSATVHDALQHDAPAARGRGLLAFGDPDYSAAGAKPAPDEVTRADPLTRLPHSAREVTEIADLFPAEERTVRLGADASVANFERAFTGRKDRLAALHVACHGHVDSRRPMLTGLFLAGGEILTLDAILRLDIPADLVVLSACNSNVSRVEFGEGTIGLVRGFFFAGCPRVVVSNWAVSDEKTSGLMVAFYRKMIRDRLPPSEALRAAKLEAMRTKETSAPHYWAPFVLWGRQD